MSLNGVRAAIVAALSTVEGVTGHPYRPAVPNAGAAWPELGPLDRAAGDAFDVTWRVWVLLDEDQQTATEWLEAHYADLYYALQPVGFVERIEQVQAGLLITMKTEE